MSDSILKARSALGVASRRHDADGIAGARRALAAAKLEAYIAKTVAEAPPLTQAQLDRLAILLRPGGAK